MFRSTIGRGLPGKTKRYSTPFHSGRFPSHLSSGRSFEGLPPPRRPLSRPLSPGSGDIAEGGDVGDTGSGHDTDPFGPTRSALLRRTSGHGPDALPMTPMENVVRLFRQRSSSMSTAAPTGIVGPLVRRFSTAASPPGGASGEPPAPPPTRSPRPLRLSDFRTFKRNLATWLADVTRDPQKSPIFTGYHFFRGRSSTRYLGTHFLGVDENGRLVPNWALLPPNGAVPGTARPRRLVAGEEFDRLGELRGRFVAPAGTPFDQRSLPADSIPQQYTRIRVVGDLDEEDCTWSTAAPGFGETGGGGQGQLRYPVSHYIATGKFEVVT